ncbi:rab GTPase-binding effector protein 1 [Eurytemora carolleeae]|uniref:rab GTPase-binding effector protein 1 n=1 Tax=Eurytemora carolleeae TaxID=1294199 RepID=UPI000C76D2DA|nr:rab GTPase-binding effector protein 1 [Eurytemora carolleeae]|eukprot:XP_023335068.1 rab GTPase-binding effector protein 1-like [Eurytemora affinis]
MEEAELPKPGSDIPEGLAEVNQEESTQLFPEDTDKNATMLEGDLADHQNLASKLSVENKMATEEISTGVYEMEASRMKDELHSLKRELDNAKSEIAVSAYLQESLVQSERENNSYREEIATLQALLVEASQGSVQEGEVMNLRRKAKALESENHDLKIQLRIAEGQRTLNKGGNVMDRESLLGSAVVLSDKTKTMVRKMKSSVVQSVNLSGGLTPEEELKRAQDDTSALKSIVEPLEEQIVALKGKLRETDSLLQEYEKRQARSLLEMQCVGSWLNGEDKSVLEQRLKDEVGDGYSEDEGQLYHTILAARIGMLTQEVEMLKADRDGALGLLDTERKEVKDLRASLSNSNTALLVERSAFNDQITKILQCVKDEDQIQEIRKISSDAENARKCNLDKSNKSPATRVVSMEEWERVQTMLDTLFSSNGSQLEAKGPEASSEELERSKLELKLIQKERDELMKEKEQLAREKEHLSGNCEKYKNDLLKEAAFRKEIEGVWNSKGEAYEVQVQELQARLNDGSAAQASLSALFRGLQEAVKRDLKLLTRDREKIVAELQRLQAENENLVGKHSALSSTMANEAINLPTSLEEMQLLLLTYREDLITAKIAKERAEEKLETEIGFMRSQLNIEHQNRTSLEQQFKADRQALQDRMRLLEPSAAELEVEKQKRRNMEERVEEIKNKHQQAQTELRKQLECARQAAQTAEAQVNQMRVKQLSLQTDLDNSVAVQNDFVRLSQSLQVELEKIRKKRQRSDGSMPMMYPIVILAKLDYPGK